MKDSTSNKVASFMIGAFIGSVIATPFVLMDGFNRIEKAIRSERKIEYTFTRPIPVEFKTSETMETTETK